MLYVMFCEDKADSESVRLETREQHLAFISENAAAIKIAGPMLTEDGEHMIGSLFVVEAGSMTEVRALNAADPYTRAGLFGNVVIHRWRQVVPAAEAS